MLALIAQGIGFGFTAGVQPGPLQGFIISTTLSRGWRSGIMVIFGPLLSDAPIILGMTLLFDTLPQGVQAIMRIVGGVFVLYLAYAGWQGLRAGQTISAGDESVPEPRRRTLVQAATINALSPGPYLYWAAVTGPVLVDALEESALHGAVFLAGFYGTFLFVMAILVLAFDRLRRLDPRITRAVLWVAIVVMALLGLILIGQGVSEGWNYVRA